jgi:hypothetical protein
MMTRSMKPEIKKEEEDSGKNLTQEELDYVRYVEGPKKP